jgi:hypothetical protein
MRTRSQGTGTPDDGGQVQTKRKAAGIITNLERMKYNTCEYVASIILLFIILQIS